jgi:hypothetical protein
MSNIGKIIRSFHCNGFAGGCCDLDGSVITSEENDYIVIRTPKNEPILINFMGWDKQKYIDEWTEVDF